ncbi:MAG: hypothetical protein KAG28_07800, partial [Cocleimonas sp.]|nr:hypothetical protein [Cocleimonas sp.]
MDRNIKLFAAASLLAVVASGCAPYNANTDTYNDNSALGSGASQNASGASQNTQTVENNKTCAPCVARNNTYTKPRVVYKPKPKVVYKPPVNRGEHSQQWYVDRWNRQQQ